MGTAKDAREGGPDEEQRSGAQQGPHFKKFKGGRFGARSGNVDRGGYFPVQDTGQETQVRAFPARGFGQGFPLCSSL
jgi:hypothetical protein